MCVESYKKFLQIEVVYVKKFLALTVAAIILITANVFAASYVGNANSKKFHYADCRAAGKIKPANRVTINSREEAIAAGYVPCKICKP